MTPRAIVFDLFGTVVHFRADVPTVAVAGIRRQTTLGWLAPLIERDLPGVAFDAFLNAILRVTEEVIRGRAPEFLEVPSRERFRRALVRLGLGDEVPVAAIAERLSLTHMEHLTSLTEMPPEHRELLAALGRRYRLALVSNFDHAPTARRVLARHGVDHCFDPILISDDFGRRKPHPSIFAAALACMDVAPAEALFVGDSTADDLVGAHGAGLPVVWVNPKGEPLPAGIAAPQYEVTRLTELAERLLA